MKQDTPSDLVDAGATRTGTSSVLRTMEEPADK
jgi:hypothetical protein